MSWRLIESEDALHEALASLPPAAAVAVDTEFMRRNTFYPQIALLQLYAGDEVYLIDPLSVGPADALRTLLIDEERPKVLHSCSEDLEVFRHWLGVLPRPLIDTQRAAALVGVGYGLGYRSLVEQLIGVELDKGETRSDWLRRPLTESQCHYAALDVLHLLPAWEMLRERAERQGRLDWVLEEGEEQIAALLDREEGQYRRVKGSRRLDARSLAVLASLVDWRENRARESDKPRGWVLDDKACLALARAKPENTAALAALDVLPQGLLRRQGDTLLQKIEEAGQLPDEALPQVGAPALQEAQRRQLKALKSTARELAEELLLAPEILLSGADLELLVREEGGESIAAPQRWSGWRAETVLPRLRDSLKQ